MLNLLLIDGLVRHESAARRGRVRVSGRHLVDDDGPFLGRIASLFYAPWAERDDVPRLERNLGALRTGGFHGYRALSGLEGESWADRRIDWRDVDTVVRLIDRGYDAFGLRCWLVPFADGYKGTTNDDSDIRAVANRYCDALEGRQHKLILIEACNEISKGRKFSFAFARELTRLFRDRLGVIAIPSAPGSEDDAEELYGGLDAPAANAHLDRSIEGDGGRFEPVWEMFETPHWIPQVDCYLSGEPTGPGASVEPEYDPLRLVLTYANTGITGGALYCLHTYAGIRGGGAWDQSDISGQPRSGPEHLDETPGWGTIVGGMAAVEAVLPGDIASWERHNGHWGTNPLDFVLGQPHNGPFEDGRLFRACTMVRGSEFWTSVLRVRNPPGWEAGDPEGFEVGARRRMSVFVLDLLTMQPLEYYGLSNGDRFRLKPRQPSGWNWDGDGFVLCGKFD